MGRQVNGGTTPLSKTQYVYEWLKEEILSGAMSPGARIRQQEVARRLGVSYTPVREAIRQLQATGLITYEANRGSAVNSLTPDAVRELYMLRGAVEGLGAELAAGKIDDAGLAGLARIHEKMKAIVGSGHDLSELAALSREFHGLVIEAGGPLIVYPKVSEIWSHYPIPRSQSLWLSVPHARRALEAHTRIIDALAKRDGALARRIMEGHIVESVRYREG